MKSSFSGTWFCKGLSPLKQLLIPGEINAWRKHIPVCCCSRSALRASQGSVTTTTLSLPLDVLQSTVTYSRWQLCAVACHPACIIATCCVTCEIQLLEGTEGWVGLSELLRDILHERFQNKLTNLFFYMLEVISCLLLKPVRKKTWDFVFYWKKYQLAVFLKW